MKNNNSYQLISSITIFFLLILPILFYINQNKPEEHLKIIKNTKTKPTKPNEKDIATFLMVSYMKDPERHLLIPMGDFKYTHHTCHVNGANHICTACYTHPQNHLGVVNLKCPEICFEDKECYRICKPIDTKDLKENNVDISYCEISENE